MRIASSISQVFSQAPYEEGYDVTIGTSDKGASVHSVESKSLNYKHLLIVFGGIFGLENAVENDDDLNVEDPSLLFDHYFNVVPTQGSRTIRTEEAVLITLATLGEKLAPTQEPPEFKLKDLIAQSEDTGHTSYNSNNNGNNFAEPMKRKNKEKKEKSQSFKPSSDDDHNESDPLDRFD